MMFALGLMIVALPILDVASLIKAGALWGFWTTAGMVLGAGLLGITIVRHQGLSIGRQVQQSLNAGRLPVIEAFDGACVLVAGAMLLFPGLVSDALALLLLLPPVRALLRRGIGWSLRRSGERMVWQHQSSADFTLRPTTSHPGGTIIEGEFQTVEPPPAKDTHLHPPKRLDGTRPTRDDT